MDLFVYFTWGINKSQVVPVDKMFESEVGEAKGRDEGTGDAVHDDHGEHQQHSGVLLTKPGRLEIHSHIHIVIWATQIMNMLI